MGQPSFRETVSRAGGLAKARRHGRALRRKMVDLQPKRRRFRYKLEGWEPCRGTRPKSPPALSGGPNIRMWGREAMDGLPSMSSPPRETGVSPSGLAIGTHKGWKPHGRDYRLGSRQPGPNGCANMLMAIPSGGQARFCNKPCRPIKMMALIRDNEKMLSGTCHSHIE